MAQPSCSSEAGTVSPKPPALMHSYRKMRMGLAGMVSSRRFRFEMQPFFHLVGFLRPRIAQAPLEKTGIEQIQRFQEMANLCDAFLAAGLFVLCFRRRHARASN